MSDCIIINSNLSKTTLSFSYSLQEDSMRLNLKIIFSALLVLLGSTVFAAKPLNNNNSSNFTAGQVSNIKEIVHSYLVAHPEVLVEAWQSLQQKKEAAAQKTAESAIKDNLQALLFAKGNPVAGNPYGSVNLVEFFDYQCSHCRTIGPVIDKLIHSHKDLRVVFKDWPIFKGNSILAAKAAFAANAQGKYLQYHNLLLAAKPPIDNAIVMQLAQKAGLDLAKFKADLNSDRWQAVLDANSKLAAKLALVGTPAFVITNRSGTKMKFIPGGVSEAVFDDIIKSINS
jgi:protein-disulfide isomerase